MDEPNIKNYLEYEMVAAQFGEDTAPKPPIETAEQAIQEMGDSLVFIIDQMLKGSWKDDNDHDVKNNVAMIESTNVMQRVMEFRTRTMGYADVSEIMEGKIDGN